MPIITAMAYIFCIWFFVYIQRETKNISEKVAAFASAGMFIPSLVRLICGHFSLIPPLLFSSLYLDAALTVTATIAIIARTVQLFIADRKSSQTAA